MSLGIDHVSKIAGIYEAAWNSGDPAKVAACYVANGGIVINRGTPWQGRAKVAEMAAGFYADVNDMCQRQSKSEPEGSAKCCHFGGGAIAA